jgi:hypothetical protein
MSQFKWLICIALMVCVCVCVCVYVVTVTFLYQQSAARAQYFFSTGSGMLLPFLRNAWWLCQLMGPENNNNNNTRNYKVFLE